LLGSKERCPERLAKGADVADVNAKNNIGFTAFPLWGREAGCEGANLTTERFTPENSAFFHGKFPLLAMLVFASRHSS